MRVVLLLIIAFAFAMPARGANFPAFSDLPTEPLYAGPTATPVLASAEAKRFRTRLLAAASERANFAGHYRIVQWGCGTSCVSGAVEDAVTGSVVFFPFSVSCCQSGPPKSDMVKFKPISRLIKFVGQRDGEGAEGVHYYEFTGKGFKYLSTDPAISDN